MSLNSLSLEKLRKPEDEVNSVCWCSLCSLVPRLPDLFQCTRALKKIGEPGDEAIVCVHSSYMHMYMALYSCCMYTEFEWKFQSRQKKIGELHLSCHVSEIKGVQPRKKLLT